MLRDTSFDDVEYVELDANDIPESEPEVQTSYLSKFTYAVADAMKQGVVYTAYAVGGSFVAVAVAPRVLPFVVNYVVPSAAAPGILASTTTAALGVMSFKFGSQLSSMGTEAALDLTVVAMKGAANMLFSTNAKAIQSEPQKTKTINNKNPSKIKHSQKIDNNSKHPAKQSLLHG